MNFLLSLIAIALHVLSDIVSPDFLGMERLRKVEVFLQRICRNVKSYFAQQLEGLSKAIFALAIILFIPLFLDFLSQKLSQNKNKKSIQQPIIELNTKNKKLLINIREHAKRKVLSLAFTMFLSSTCIYIYFSYSYLSFFDSLSTQILHRVEGENRLYPVLDWWSKFFARAGNIIQFIAMFVPAPSSPAPLEPTKPLPPKSHCNDTLYVHF